MRNSVDIFKGKEAALAFKALLAFALLSACAFVFGCASEEPKVEEPEPVVEEVVKEKFPTDFHSGTVQFSWGSIDLDALGNDMVTLTKVSEDEAYLKYVARDIPIGHIGPDLDVEEYDGKQFSLGVFEEDGKKGEVELYLYFPGNDSAITHFVGQSDRLVLTKVLGITPYALAKCIMLNRGDKLVATELKLLEDTRFIDEKMATTVITDPFDSGFGEEEKEDSSSSAATTAPQPDQGSEQPAGNDASSGSNQPSQGAQDSSAGTSDGTSSEQGQQGSGSGSQQGSESDSQQGSGSDIFVDVSQGANPIPFPTN